VLLIGKVTNWNRADRTHYRQADAIAVSVYSHVFNTNPGLDDAQLLLLDDAHAAESAVASPWSLDVDRGDEHSAYFDVLSVLADALDPLVLTRLRTETAFSQYDNDVYLASPLGVAARAAHLEQTAISRSACSTCRTVAC
jgi:hypothetical protein